MLVASCNSLYSLQWQYEAFTFTRCSRISLLEIVRWFGCIYLIDKIVPSNFLIKMDKYSYENCCKSVINVWWRKCLAWNSWDLNLVTQSIITPYIIDPWVIWCPSVWMALKRRLLFEVVCAGVPYLVFVGSFLWTERSARLWSVLWCQLTPDINHWLIGQLFHSLFALHFPSQVKRNWNIKVLIIL